MHLAYLSDSFIPSRFANSVHVMNMAAGLAATGTEVTLVTRQGPEPVADPFSYYGVPRSFTLRQLPWRRIKGRSYVMAAEATLAVRSRVDVAFGRNVPALWLAARLGLPTALESHAPPAFYLPWERALLNDLMRHPRCRGLVVISRPLEAAWTKWLRPSRQTVRVLPDAAMDPGTVTPVSPEAKVRLQAGYIGSLYAGRGVELLLELAHRCPFTDIHLAGGNEADVARLRTATADLPNLYLHGFLPPADTAAFRAGCDVLLAPYQATVTVAGKGDTSGWMSPLKVFEYMAAGRALVVSDLPVLHEVLSPDVNCLMCPPEDVAAWASALERLATEPGLCRRLGENARLDFLARYTWTGRAEQILQLFAPDSV